MSYPDPRFEDIPEEPRQEILKCIQCGTCSASCPFNNQMDHAPRELFALIMEGEVREVLTSNTPWFCVSCYHCMTRCPRLVPVTDIMYSLKQRAMELGLEPKKNKMPYLYRAFRDIVTRRGRVTGALVLTKYGVSHPLDIIRNTPIGLKLIKKGRFDLFPKAIKDWRKIK